MTKKEIKQLLSKLYEVLVYENSSVLMKEEVCSNDVIRGMMMAFESVLGGELPKIHNFVNDESLEEIEKLLGKNSIELE